MEISLEQIAIIKAGGDIFNYICLHNKKNNKHCSLGFFSAILTQRTEQSSNNTCMQPGH